VATGNDDRSESEWNESGKVNFSQGIYKSTESATEGGEGHACVKS
jgi:hypothetical protein